MQVILSLTIWKMILEHTKFDSLSKILKGDLILISEHLLHVDLDFTFSDHIYYLIEKLEAWALEMCALFLPISIVVCFIPSNSYFFDLGVLSPIFLLIVLYLCGIFESDGLLVKL